MFRWRGEGGGGWGGEADIVATFEHFFCSHSLGILTTNFVPDYSFVKHRKGYFISLNNVPVLRAGNWTEKMLKNSIATRLPTTPSPSKH